MRNLLNELKSIGFEKLGHWRLDDSEISLNIVNHNLSQICPALYAFTISEEVMYVGKTNQKLSSRLYGYKNPDYSQKTNLRINSFIRDKLDQSKNVEIFVFHEITTEKRGKFTLNIPAALEDDIIGRLQPEWNISSKPSNSKNQRFIHSEKDSASESSKSANEITEKWIAPHAEVTIGESYFNQGFFNIGVDHEKHIGNNGESITIHLGNQGGSITGKINRSCNPNNTPRIMGGIELREWIKKNFQEGEVFRVDIITPNEIKVSKSVS